MMTRTRILILGPFVRQQSIGKTLLLDCPDATLTISNGSVLRQAIEQLAHGVVESACTLPANVLDQMIGHGMVASLPAYSSNVTNFMSEFASMCDAWVVDIFLSPFWDLFHSGQATDAQVWTFLCQLYHRTAGADLHNRIAAEQCAEPEISALLLRHYEEELGHACILADGLRRCGAAAAAHVNMAPLASTRALIDFMVEISVDPVAYLGCYGVFHAPSTIRSEKDLLEQFAHYARMYPFAAEAFAAVGRHAALDYQLEHDHIALEEWVKKVGPPGPRDVAAAARGARGAALAFRSIFDDCARAC